MNSVKEIMYADRYDLFYRNVFGNVLWLSTVHLNMSVVAHVVVNLIIEKHDEKHE